MRILYLANMSPLPMNNGHRMRMWFMLRALRAEGHSLSLLTLGHEMDVTQHRDEILTVCDAVQNVPFNITNLSQSSKFLPRLLALFGDRPFAVQRFESPQMREQITHMLEGEHFDAVMCDSVFSAVNLPDISTPMLLNLANLEHEILLRFSEQEPNPFKRLYARLEARKLLAWELETTKRSSMSMVCSEREQKILQKLSPHPVYVVPNVIDTDDYQARSAEVEKSLIYTGGMDWYPNRDAVEFFVRKVLPHLRVLAPGVRLVVAGRNPSAEFLARFQNDTDVRFTGTVPDMQPLIGESSVVIVPLRMGSGTRLKILEAAAMGKAIVSTTLGAEGLDFNPGEAIELRDEPAAFAEAVAQLLHDGARRKRMGAAARKTVEAKYSLQALQRALQQALHGYLAAEEPHRATVVAP